MLARPGRLKAINHQTNSADPRCTVILCFMFLFLLTTIDLYWHIWTFLLFYYKNILHIGGGVAVKRDIPPLYVHPCHYTSYQYAYCIILTKQVYFLLDWIFRKITGRKPPWVLARIITIGIRIISQRRLYSLKGIITGINYKVFRVT